MFAGYLGHSRTHLEPTRSNVAAAKYCEKEGDYREWGKRPGVGQGRRSDLDALNELVEAVNSSALTSDVFDLMDGENTKLVFAHYKLLKEYKHYAMRKSSAVNKDTFHVTLCLGPPGSGKSRWIADEYPDAYWVTYGEFNGTTWFDGYVGQQTIVLDDFKGNMPYTRLLRLCDRYRQDLPVKGGMVPALHTRVVISSIKDPTQWYDYTKGCKNVREIERRISRVINFPINDLERRLVNLNPMNRTDV